MKKFCFIIPYYGKWPEWTGIFLKSCAYNTCTDILIFCDNQPGFDIPENVYCHIVSKKNLQELIHNKLQLTVDLSNPYKLCDLKPAYGKIFEGYTENYDYWGYGDIDVLWGNIWSFTKSFFEGNYDIFVPHPEFVPGHFCLLRNNRKTIQLFTYASNYRNVFTNPKYHFFDERYDKKGIHLKSSLMRKQGGRRIRKHLFLSKIKKLRVIRLFRGLLKASKSSNSQTRIDFSSIVKQEEHLQQIKTYRRVVYADDIGMLQSKTKDHSIRYVNGSLFCNDEEVLYYHFQLNKYSGEFIKKICHENLTEGITIHRSDLLNILKKNKKK